MPRELTLAQSLAERTCRPQRIGVFGHRGVGKTTLLTMLYREAVGGRLPQLRLAAADARTADYLSDKVLQLEAGEALPATLGETELRFHLYYQGCRLDLLFKDYQGEHVALGREEPIRDFLRDCDAIWLCLDVPVVGTPEARLRAQQEVEQLIEDYLTAEPQGAIHRPMALVVTKSDLLDSTITGPQTVGELAVTPTGAPTDPGTVEVFAQRQFAMTQHALRLHCPQHALFAVSSLGGPIAGPGPFSPRPMNLEAPLVWLAQALQAQDEARLHKLWQEAGNDYALLVRCVAAFRRRWPDAPFGEEQERRLVELKRRRRRRRLTAAAAVLACLFLGVGTYDAVAEQRTDRFASEHGDDPVAVREYLRSFQSWHPTRHLFRPAAARGEQERMQALDVQVRAKEREERLAEVRRQSANPDADAEGVWELYQQFRSQFPEQDLDEDLRQFRTALEGRRNAERERRARDAFAELERLERQTELAALVERADRFLRDYAGTSREPEVRRHRETWLRRQDERDVDEARAYSAAQPLNFQTRRERFQRYLERHPEGAFAKEARDALTTIHADWDRHDFRQVRDHYQDHSGDIKELERLCRSYLAVHTDGRFRDAARDLLRWTERVTQPGEYRVVLKSGAFDKKVAAWISRGPYLSVEIEVGGVRYGPSNIVPRNYNPEWNYEFPRRVKWKLGDSVRIIVTDNYYWNRHVATIASEDGDAVGMRLLCGEVQSGKNSLIFESDFALPKLPAIE